MRAALAILLRLQQQHPIAFWSGALLALLPAAAGIALLAVSGWLITSAAMSAALGGTALVTVSTLSFRVRFYAALRIFGRYAERLVTHDATFRFLSNLRRDVFRGVVAQTRKDAEGSRTASLLSRVVSDVDQLDGLYLRLALPLFVTIVITGMSVIILFQYAPPAALAIAAVQILGISILAKTAGQEAREHAQKYNSAKDSLRVRTADMVRGRRDLSVYGGLDRQQAKIMRAASRLEVETCRAEQEDTQSTTFISALSQSLLAITFALTAWAMQQGQLELRHMALFAFVALALPELLVSAANGAGSWARMAGAAQRVTALLKAGEERDAVAAQQTLKIVGRQNAEPVLQVNDLTYAYPSTGHAPLAGVSFSLNQGEQIAIVGPSGAGKSTLTALLARLLTPGSGTIKLAGADLAMLCEEDLRQNLVVVGQRTQIFHDTVAANLRLAKPEASEDELWQALALAGLDDRIRREAMGLETVLGESGLGLSGGEGRRLALARAYLRKPRLWIADELTEGLDATTAKQVLQSFLTMSADAGALLISHRALEVARVSKVLELKNGSLDELPLPLGAAHLARLRPD
ncbi:thiol reductant ABC exporter subunit CydC [Polycladidibacter hongkongensis]|uniref:thiol reductant ABC exporter subunit CydC n=1 Tax=Polycladidibacter hongkongensis TaxID=1647556 RepID=UPI0008372E6E|nr:thiol reductant ABC exporter subunit CydC [Pseudovibrio hongkongensis]